MQYKSWDGSSAVWATLWVRLTDQLALAPSKCLSHSQKAVGPGHSEMVVLVDDNELVEGAVILDSWGVELGLLVPEERNVLPGSIGHEHAVVRHLSPRDNLVQVDILSL